MDQLLMMVMFYANYLWLTPRYFVSGKHRYFLIINTLFIVGFVVFLHYWGEYTRLAFQPNAIMPRWPDALDEFFFYVRDLVNLTVFATAGTCIALASRWFWADDARKLAETARVKAETAQVTAELSNLRSQINPHFLLNTLNNIYALTAFDTPKAQQAIQELSKMLRHILYDYQQPKVALSDEVEFLQNYVNLMRIRLSDSVDVKFQTFIANPQLEVAPMVFISLVENAFKHGVSPSEPSFIHIQIESADNQIVCDIQNSNHPKTANDHSGHGIGLVQVQRRLELTYPDHYQWEHGPTDDGIYRSRIVIDTKE
jgi:two-component sensor histidine kinase